MRVLLTIFALCAIVSCGSPSGVKRASATAVSHKNYGYKVVAQYPHDTHCYTQGLYFDNGLIFEGSGVYGSSSLSRKELTSGKTLKEKRLNDKYFGEGITLHQGKIYQLTWQEGTAFVYDPKSFEQLGTRTYTGEGWGLTSDGKSLYMSDGSDKIYTIDPDSFDKLSSIVVRLDGRAISALNELEWIDGEIWANVYGSDAIVIINPQSGDVRAVVNLSDLLPQEQMTEQTDVLNGIAYDSEGKRIFVTGKNWAHLYHIELIER